MSFNASQSAASGGSPKPSGVRNSPKVPSKNKDHQQNVQQQSYALAAAGHRGSPRKGIVERRDSTSAGRYDCFFLHNNTQL